MKNVAQPNTKVRNKKTGDVYMWHARGIGEVRRGKQEDVGMSTSTKV